MPDPQQHAAVSSRGLDLFRSIGRRIVRSEKKRYENDSTSDSGQDAGTSNESKPQRESAERRLSEETPDFKQKRVSLQVDTTDSCSEKTTTSTTSSSDIMSSLGKVFQNLGLGGKNMKKKKQQQQKSILRRPVTHVYVRGISGLPQRVPYHRDPYRRSAVFSTSNY